ncbi:MAG: DUF362 domain-containing protein [Spirochaetes bacterium]|nr:MAG: DUF362 domain-containing protein [Spirochaetota bacterium]
MSMVYFADFRCNSKDNVFSKVRKLFLKAGFGACLQEKDFVAIKTHFGEYGNLAFIPAPVLKTIVEMVTGAGGRPFLTDSNTLYRGSRSNALDHLRNAAMNGFLLETAGAPVIIADGLRGNDFRTVPAKGKYFKDIKIASAIHDADAVVVVSHVKGHELYGFGGAIKNLAMGCAPPAGKQMLHSDMKPKVKEALCTACNACVRRCPSDAIIINARKKAEINQDACISCGECTVICPNEAVPVLWKTDFKPLHERSGEYVKAMIDTKPGKWMFFNFIMNVSPQCDCYYWNDTPVVPNLGILASTDPVAIDMASADLINRAAPMPGSKIAGKDPSKDNLQALYDIDWKYQLQYAEKIGMGTCGYEIVEI